MAERSSGPGNAYTVLLAAAAMGLIIAIIFVILRHFAVFEGGVSTLFQLSASAIDLIEHVRIVA